MKATLITNILTRVKTIYGSMAEVEAVKKKIMVASFRGSGDLHTLYKSWFNLVDLGDKYWYAAADYHGNRQWKSKMLYSIMHRFMVNVWVLSIFKKESLWIDF